MAKTLHFMAGITLTVALIFTSCVPNRYYYASKNMAERLQKDSVEARNRLNDCNSQVLKLKKDQINLQYVNDSLKGEMKDLSSESKMTIADQAKRLKKLEDLIQSQKNVMAKLKNTMADALMKYKSDELTVHIKNGNVYVSLEEKLLFKSGSDVVDPKGKEALKSLAKVLNNTKDISVIIEGHTDNVPIKTKRFKDNWDLSTARATSIIRILTNDYKVDSKRITASGRGKFHPVKTNDTATGRAGNRRTEVILSPDLKELYKLLDQ
jgi:chemotaxis protein MotB